MIPKSNWKVGAVLNEEERVIREKTLGLPRSQARSMVREFHRAKSMSKARRKRWLKAKEKRAEVIARGSWFESLFKLFSPKWQG